MNYSTLQQAEIEQQLNVLARNDSSETTTIIDRLYGEMDWVLSNGGVTHDGSDAINSPDIFRIADRTIQGKNVLLRYWLTRSAGEKAITLTRDGLTYPKQTNAYLPVLPTESLEMLEGSRDDLLTLSGSGTINTHRRLPYLAISECIRFMPEFTYKAQQQMYSNVPRASKSLQ